MKSLFYVILWIGISLFTSQKSQAQFFEGVWEGELYQWKDTFEIVVELDQEGSKLKGVSHVDDRKGHEGEITLEGSTFENTVSYKDLKITKKKHKNPYFHWCLKDVKLTYTRLYGRDVLTGTWSGIWSGDSTTECPPGKILLRKRLDNRKLKAGKRIEVKNREIVVKVSDLRNPDGDSITLIFNNKIILTRHLLTKKPKVLKLKIDEKLKENTLILYAENLGKHPPNTAFITIIDGKNKRSFYMESDLSENDIVYLITK
jgi:hypothetical protein